MRKSVLIFLFSIVVFNANAQVVFKTILKKGPVVTGESFTVQYVLEDIGRSTEFFPPDFKEFRFISGPVIHEATAYGTDGIKKMRNFIITLEATRPGRYIIKGASAKVDNHFIESDDAVIEVITKTEAARRQPVINAEETPYFLYPGEDPYQKIRQNLFLKVMTDKRTCFVGEPITATFKLYSRLVSKSDIVKNPGFYGFTVQDIVGLNDKVSGVETINGKKFDVHTIRKVQLYPLRPGLFMIDPMEVKSKVEFSRSVVTKKPEQEISEGIYPDNTPGTTGTETYESDMNTKSVAIEVKSLPSKGRPDDFSGATGHFLIRRTVNKTELARNEEGKLTIKVSGKGNFTQLQAPVVQWPQGLEGFDPQMTDTLDHTQSPLKGSRTFHFSFTAANPGLYVIPSVSFSFFDPDSNSYKTVSTDTATIVINNRETKQAQTPDKKNISGKKSYTVFIWLGIIFVFIAGVWFLWRKNGKQAKKLGDAIKKEDDRPDIATLLQPAEAIADSNDRTFYITLRSCIWNFFALHFELSGSQMNRQNLVSVMNYRQVNERDRLSILEILEQCETGMFTDAKMEMDKRAMLEKTKEALKNISNLK
jgi:hypothetical protein